MHGPRLRAIAPTPFVTLQDGGRRGWRRFGLSGAGAMDRLSLAIANALVGNRATEAALEFAYAAGEWTAEAHSCRIAIAGAGCASIDGMAVPPLTSAVLRRGQRLRIGSSPQCVWGYLAVAGGFAIAPEFGSRSTHVRTGIGGLGGRTIRGGDTLPLLAAQASDEPERVVALPPGEAGPCRVVLGPQEDFFDEHSISVLLNSEYRVTWQQDRMAYRLDGPNLCHSKGYNIISDGVMPGCIQVPGTGTPIVLMRDAGTVGGYPKIAAVVEADLGRMVQMRPGGIVRFQAIGVAEAHALRRRYLARLQLIAEAMAPSPSALI
ncbi:MAG TPA: biotin-dependent carboxyltransferase family protein [Acetobacteraceae bacterium]